MIWIAQKNSINPKVKNNRMTGEAQGPFLELVERFEKVLPPQLQPNTRAASANACSAQSERRRSSTK
jgi:hypothetical protein